MITIEELTEALDSMWIDDWEYIFNPDQYWYSDVMEYHRSILWYFNLSFNIAELKESDDDSTTIIYTWSSENNIVVFWIWLPKFTSMEEYVDWLNRNEEQALHINK